MKRDYPNSHQFQFENKGDVINKLLGKIVNLEKEVEKLRQENRILKYKYISSLKNNIKEKSNPFSMSLQMGDTNCIEINQMKKKAPSFFQNNEISKPINKLNQTQANLSMYLTTDINDNADNSNNNKQVINSNNSISKKKNKKVLSLSQNTIKAFPEIMEPKLEASYIITESESSHMNYYKENPMKKELKKQFRPNSMEKEYIIKDNCSSNNINSSNSNINSNTNTLSMTIKDNKTTLADYTKTRNTSNTIYNTNEKYQSNYSNRSNHPNVNNSSNPPSLSFIYSKKITTSTEKMDLGRKKKEKENQLIQIHRKLFSKSPILNKNYNEQQ